MKIRIESLPEEVEETVKTLEKVFNVLSVSKPYYNRGMSKLVRTYIDVQPLGQTSDRKKVQQTFTEAWKKSKEENLI